MCVTCLLVSMLRKYAQNRYTARGDSKGICNTALPLLTSLFSCGQPILGIFSLVSPSPCPYKLTSTTYWQSESLLCMKWLACLHAMQMRGRLDDATFPLAGELPRQWASQHQATAWCVPAFIPSSNISDISAIWVSTMHEAHA